MPKKEIKTDLWVYDLLKEADISLTAQGSDLLEVNQALADFCAREDSECFRAGIEEERQKYSWSRMLQTIKSV